MWRHDRQARPCLGSQDRAEARKTVRRQARPWQAGETVWRQARQCGGRRDRGEADETTWRQVGVVELTPTEWLHARLCGGRLSCYISFAFANDGRWERKRCHLLLEFPEEVVLADDPGESKRFLSFLLETKSFLLSETVMLFSMKFLIEALKLFSSSSVSKVLLCLLRFWSSLSSSVSIASTSAC